MKRYLDTTSALSVIVGLLLVAGCGSESAPTPCGGVDQRCCATATDACNAGLGCSAGTCIEAPFVAGAACSAPTECESAICGGDSLCTQSACDDGVKNGLESDVDCGGACATRCDLGATCGDDADCGKGTCFGGTCGYEPGGLLGKGGAADTVAWTQVAGASDGLWAPADLAFSPEKQGQLWIVDRDRDAFLVVQDPGTDKSEKRLILDISQHFLEEVLAISFDGHGTFGTCGDSRNSYGGQAPPNDFMGPVQWPADLNHYPQGKSAHEQHWDMLHSTPRCMGMAAAAADQYFCFNGQLGSIDWYDFHEPHVPGGDDHSDGEKRRYQSAEITLGRVAGVPSNMERDPATGILYIADSGNGRIVRFDPAGAQKGKFVPSFQLDGIMHEMTGFSIDVLIGGQLTMPTGVALHQGTLYVADRGTGLLHAFTLGGEPLRTLDTGIGKDRLGGLTAGPDDRLYLVDIGGKRVLRVETTW
ncbi:MAG: hypothetical protein H6747_00655 [Deltaproteobacteria bacterium]|nr:hypothetical protein [Deltaproteobacteria bacterium]